jgi:hypothetical protein
MQIKKKKKRKIKHRAADALLQIHENGLMKPKFMPAGGKTFRR